MEFDNEQGFPGLYNADSGKRSNESDYSDGDHDKPSRKDLLIGRRKDKKESKKDRGYAALEGESSPEDEAETKSPSKSKKTKAFKFPSKSKEKREKSRDKEKVAEKDSKEKEQLDKEKKREKSKKEKEKKEKEKIKEKEKEEKVKIKESKEKVKEKEKSKDKDKKEKKTHKQQASITTGVPFEEIFTLGVLQPIFGVPLSLAVQRSKCHDDTNLPLIVRHCIDFIQEFALDSETVYRIEPPKDKIQTLKKMYNDRELVTEKNYDIPTACSLLKLFITELPEPVLTTELCSQFEEVAPKPDKLSSLISQLPSYNKVLLQWLIGHFVCLLKHEKNNKLNVNLLATLLGGVVNMSNNLLAQFISNFATLFPDFKVTKYVPPLSSIAKLPETADEIVKELKKQESMLSQIHAEMHAGFVTQKREEQLWEGQRIVTQLKRKLRSVQKTNDPPTLSRAQSSTEERQITIDDEEKEKQPVSKIPDKPTPESEQDLKTSFAAGSFEDNFDNISDSNPSAEKNDMTDSVYSTNSEVLPPLKSEKPTLSSDELNLMRLQLEHEEYLQLKSILQAKINSERFEIVKLRTHMAIKNKQENNCNQIMNKDVNPNYSDAEMEEKQRLIKENLLLEQKRLALANQIFQERMTCIQLKIQLAMNEIL